MATLSARNLFNKKTMIIAMMGIASGLPLALIGGTLQAWMRSEKVDLSTIGLFAFVTLPYTLKFLWAPFMDRFQITKFGRRRSWMVVTQVLLILSVLGLAYSNPRVDVMWVAAMSMLVCFFSASQDIVIDAWRREALTDDELGWGSSVHVAFYLVAFRLISGGLALVLSDFMEWSSVYTIMAGVLTLGIVATLLCEEPAIEAAPPRSLKEAVLDPFIDYFSRPSAWLILIFILLYKIGDNMALQMTTPFFIDLGFTKTEIGVITKLVGWVSLSIGGLLGGALILRLKIGPSLFWFGVLQFLAILSFTGLALMGKSTPGLTFVIAFENFAVGMGTSAFVAFMATLTNKRFTATQYALLTSFMGIPRTFAAAPTGWMAQYMGWPVFFTVCALCALPALVLIGILKKREVI